MTVSHVELARLPVLVDSEHGADVSAKNQDGWTPLHRAFDWHLSEDHVELAQFLVEHGCRLGRVSKGQGRVDSAAIGR